MGTGIGELHNSTWWLFPKLQAIRCQITVTAKALWAASWPILIGGVLALLFKRPGIIFRAFPRAISLSSLRGWRLSPFGVAMLSIELTSCCGNGRWP